ncbi:MAG TPA: outer membrane protein transport protein [Polyangia bacterium]
MRKTIILALLAFPSAALANGYDVPNINPRDLGMSGAAVAAQRDAAATYALPAALSRMEGFDLSLSGAFLDLHTTWKAPEGSSMAGSPDTSTKFHPAYPLSLFASYGTRIAGHGAGAGFGMNIPAGGNVYWPDDWSGRGQIITVNRRLYGFYLSVAYELISRIRLSAGLNYIHATEYMKQGIQPSLDSYGELSAAGGGFGFQLSGELKPLGQLPLTIAVDYKHKVRMNLTGAEHFVTPQSLLQPGTTAPPVDQGVTHDLTYPSRLSVSAAYRVVKPLLLAGAYAFDRYSVYKQDLFQGDKGTNITVPRNYGNGHTFRLGAEYTLREQIDLRVGALRDISGLDVRYYSPTLPDANAWAASAGVGYTVGHNLTFNAAFFYAWLDQIRQTGDLEIPGIYDTRVYIISAGLEWRR